MDLYDLELAKAADKLVRERTLLGLEAGESLLICADTQTDRRVVESTARAAHVSGVKVATIWYAAPPDVGEKAVVPRPVAAAMASTDVMVEFSKKYLLFSESWRTAIERGVRYLGLWGMDADMAVRLVGNVNWPKLIKFGEKLAEVSKKVNTMRITSPAGTDVTFRLDAARPFVRSETQGGLAGEIAWAPIEESINGKIVFDGVVFPPEEIGLIRTPIELCLKRGKVTGIDGGAEARRLKQWLETWKDNNMYNIAHFSYGFNPGARLCDRIIEADRVFGTVVVGIGYQRDTYRGKAGTAASHCDGTMLVPSIRTANKYIEKEGRYVHPELAELSEGLLFET
jgi:leucyl aminopeptidase (aminopeptidase T)